eukprot:Awhi_evm1s6765
MAHIHKILELFSVVPSMNGRRADSEPVFVLKDVAQNVLITESAQEHEREIKEYYNSKEVDMNSTFYKSWKKVQDSSHHELLLDLILHYTTLHYAGIQDHILIPRYEVYETCKTFFPDKYKLEDGKVYFPDGEIILPDKEGDKRAEYKFTVIATLHPDEIIEKCMAMLCSGLAMKQQTIRDVIFIMQSLGFVFKGDEKIANKEAVILIADMTGCLPTSSSELFRYLFYKATDGETMIIKNATIVDKILEVEYKLPRLTKEKICLLAQTFNRFKPIWMAIKASNDDNRNIVNRVTKASKTCHVPMGCDVLGSLTSQTFSKEEILKACKKATLFRVIRALNAVRLYQVEENEKNKFYKVRNGKSWTIITKETTPRNTRHGTSSRGRRNIRGGKRSDYTMKPRKPKRARTDNQSEDRTEKLYQLNLAEDILIGFLLSQLKHLKGKKIYLPETIDYALPVSEKMFSGNIPKGTLIKLPFKATKEALMIGVHWYGDNVIYDLSSISVSGNKIGWNAKKRDDAGTLLHSGDRVHAPLPDGAAEWLYCTKEIKEDFLVMNNLYSSHNEHIPYKIMLGYGDKVTINYMMDPGKVIFEIDTSDEVAKQNVLGYVHCNEEGLGFYLLDQGFGNGMVACGNDPKLAVIRNHVMNTSKSALMVRELLELVGAEIISNKEEDDDVDYDLCYTTLAKDSITGLFESKEDDFMLVDENDCDDGFILIEE